VVNALADALSLDATERDHLRYLTKITGGACATHRRPSPPSRHVRPAVLATLQPRELVVLLPADETTAQARERLRRQPGRILRAIS